MRRIALALAAMAITSLAQEKAVATLCELTPSPPPAAEVGLVDRAHDVDRGGREASGARTAESAVAAIERLATARGHELNLRRLDVPGLDLGTVDIYVPDVCGG
jgi:hypothetical protein